MAKNSGKIDFEVQEPIYLPTNGIYCNFDSKEIKKIREENKEVLAKKGCYVFSVIKKNTSNTRVPIYIGKTTKQTLNAECFGSHKSKKLNNFFQEVNSCKDLCLHIISVADSVRKNAAGLEEAIDDLEVHLIVQASEHYPELVNTQNANGQAWQVAGVLYDGDGRHRKSVSTQFRNMMKYPNFGGKR